MTRQAPRRRNAYLATAVLAVRLAALVEPDAEPMPPGQVLECMKSPKAKGMKLSSTCSDRCEARRDARFRREATARGYELAPGDWRCEECGCVVEEAMARRARKDRCFPIAVRVVCSPKCARTRKYRRNAAVLRELQLTPKEKARRSAWERERRKTAPRGRSS
jgi:hypothetical protein